jgi:ankyrin repeat protein
LEFGKPAPRVRRRSVSFDPLTVFKTAILENDVDAAKSVLASGKVNANSTVDGVLPVILASKEGCAECLELLIEKGASIDVCDKRRFTPLELAVQGGHFDCAQVLIAAGANANSIRDGYFDESIEHGRHTTGRSRSRTF